MNRGIRLVLLTALALGAAAPAQAGSLKSLARKLQKGLKGQENLKIAVLSFPYHDGRMSSGSTIVQERLTTHLAEDGAAEVIERKLLEKMLAEMELGHTGLIDEKTTHELGKVLGVGAIVTGTLNDLKRGRTEVNARLIEAATGRILAARMTKIRRTWTDEPRPPGATADRPDEPGPKPTPGTFLGKPLVQLAILLDTSNSMDGLISQAKTQLWRIVNELASAEREGEAPALRVALYEYGNNALSVKGDFIRQVLSFTADLDRVSEELFALRTNGGSEYCGAVILDAVDGLDWAPQADVYKVVFIAGNEPFTQGPVDFRDAVSRARAKSIFVNTVYCGDSQQGIGTQWKAGADLSGGEYLNIDQDRKVVAMRAPQDDEIERLGRDINETYIPYGSGGREASLRQEEQDAQAGKHGLAGAAVQRSMFKAKKQYSASAAWDAATLVESGEKDVGELEEDELPEPMRGMSVPEREKYIQERIERRRGIQERIRKLSAERDSYISAKQEELSKGSGELTLDQAVLKAVRKQAATKQYRFAD
ncbi:MAG: FlgO family outer membrane protein [Elusimicrobiota bacterium]